MEIHQLLSKKEKLKNNNITIIGINYYPEDSAIGLYTTQKAEYLVSKGYNVTVITGFPYYPQWQIRPEYKSKNYLIKEEINGVTVLRNKQYVPKDPTFFKRILHLISFTFGNFLNLFKISKPDIVIAIIPFTTSALLGWFLKLRYKAKLWVHVQDFEFDAAIDSGLLSGNKKGIINALQWVEKKVLNKADIVSTISIGMLNKLKGKTNVASYYLTNWLDASKFNCKKEKPHHYLESNKFKILYSGNIGAKQDWDSFFLFLDKIKGEQDIKVIVVGEGAEQNQVKKKLDTYPFTTHHNLVPFNELPHLLSSADMHILFQKDDVIDTVMPSKILGMMASGKPSLVTGNVKSEVGEIFKTSKGGYYMQNHQLEKMHKSLLKLKESKDLCNELGKNAKSFVLENYDMVKVLDKFINHLNLL